MYSQAVVKKLPNDSNSTTVFKKTCRKIMQQYIEMFRICCRPITCYSKSASFYEIGNITRHHCLSSSILKRITRDLAFMIILSTVKTTITACL